MTDDDISRLVRETVRKDNPELPLESMYRHDTWYMAEHVWPSASSTGNER